MSRQSTLSEFFTSKKRNCDQHPAKRRKVDLGGTQNDLKDDLKDNKDDLKSDLEVNKNDLKDLTELTQQENVTLTSETVTSAVDDHVVQKTPKGRRDAKNDRGHKADPKEDVDKTPEIRFTMGQTTNTKSTAKKRLQFKGQKEIRGQKVPFVKKGPLSPEKKQIVAFEKKGFLSPKKADNIISPTEDSSADSCRRKLMSTPEKKNTRSRIPQSPSEIKARLGKVTKLADLKKRLESLSSASKDVPKLSSSSFTVQVPKSPMKSPAKARVKASPVKKDDVALPTPRTPLPRHYTLLANTFRAFEDVVRTRYNRQQKIVFEEVDADVKRATRRQFGEKILKQIYCVFPEGYDFKWEPTKNKKDSQLQIFPKVGSEGDGFVLLCPKMTVQRMNVFKSRLFSMVKDQHQQYLKSLGINLPTANVRSWHADFDLDSCLEVEQKPLPSKPISEAERITATDLLTQSKSCENERLQQAVRNLAKLQGKSEKKEEPEVKKETETGEDQNKINLANVRPELRGLPESIIRKILENEKKKAIKKMMETTSDQKDRKEIKELIDIGPMIVNCFKSECHRRYMGGNRKSLPSVEFFKYCSTHGMNGRKSIGEMDKLIRKFVSIVPDYFEFKTIRNVEYFAQKSNAMDITIKEVKHKIEDLYNQQKI